MTLEKQVRDILSQEGCLNTHEVCRLINGLPKGAVDKCSLTFKEKPFGTQSNSRCGRIRNDCKVRYHTVWHCLMNMTDIYSLRKRFWDKNKSGKRFDVFRFWTDNPTKYQVRIQAQTLEAHL